MKEILPFVLWRLMCKTSLSPWVISVFCFFLFSVYNGMIKKETLWCFCRVLERYVDVRESEEFCGNTSCKRVFLQLFRVFPVFLCVDRNTAKMLSICVRDTARKTKENLSFISTLLLSLISYHLNILSAHFTSFHFCGTSSFVTKI